VCSSDLENGKRMRRKLSRKKLLPLFECKDIKNGKQFNENSIILLREYLLNIKKKIQLTSHNIKNAIGIITYDNVFHMDITKVPLPPKEWDILFLEYDVENFDYTSEYNNIYWCKSNVLDSRHFIVNINSLDKVLESLKDIKTWSEIMKRFQSKSFKTFSIIKHMFSERLDKYVKFPYDKYNCKNTSEDDKKQIMYEYSKMTFDKLKLYNDNKISDMDYTNNVNYINKFDTRTSRFSDEEMYNIYPKISLICIITDKSKFFHLLHTFLRLDYPRDKLELVIVDDFDADKVLKKILPNDSRIKFINISKKDKNGDYVKYPIGYKLNIGVQYASNELLCHFFDNNVYANDTFKNLIKCYLISGKDILLSKDYAIYTNKDDKYISQKCNVPDIANMIYRKSYWNVFGFENTSSDSNVLVYKFTHFRNTYSCYIPFLNFSFKLNDSTNIIYAELKNLPFKLINLLDENMKKSFRELNF
jgi:hypothetical protein